MDSSQVLIADHPRGRMTVFLPPDRLGFLQAKTIVRCVRTNANVELDAGTKTFASGLLPDLIAALRRSRKGDLVAVISADPSIGPELEAWCRFTRNSLVDTAIEAGRTRWVIRYGEALENVGEDRPVGSRLWLYTNFDCNLSCDYCCVRSSPKARRRALGIERVRRIASEANRVIRRIALRGSATQGIALARTDLVPEVTITAEGIFWHPVGAEDNDLLVSREIFPLAESFAAVRRAFDHEYGHQRRLAMIFNCA